MSADRIRVQKQGELWKVVGRRQDGTVGTLWGTHSYQRAIDWAHTEADARESKRLRKALRWFAKPWTDLSREEVPEC